MFFSTEEDIHIYSLTVRNEKKIADSCQREREFVYQYQKFLAGMF